MFSAGCWAENIRLCNKKMRLHPRCDQVGQQDAGLLIFPHYPKYLL